MIRIKALLTALTCLEVHAVTPQPSVHNKPSNHFSCGVVVKASVFISSRLIATGHHYNIVPLLPRIDHVVNKCAGELKPTNRFSRPLSGKHTKPGWHRGIKHNFVPPRGTSCLIVKNRMVMKNRIVLCDGHIVGQPVPREFYRHSVRHLALSIHYPVPHVRPLVAVIKVHQLPRHLIDFAVRRHARVELIDIVI